MAKNNYFNELSESFAKKNKTDIDTAKKAVSKLIRNKEDNYNSLFFRKDLSGPRYGNKLESLRNSFSYKHSRSLCFNMTIRKNIYAEFSANLGNSINKLTDRTIQVSNVNTVYLAEIKEWERYSRRHSYFVLTGRKPSGTITPSYISKIDGKYKIELTEIAGVLTCINKKDLNLEYARCIYVTKKPQAIIRGYIHIPTSTHGKNIDEIKNLLQKREDLKNASKVKRDFAKQIKISSSDILVTRNDSINAGNCSAGTDNFISRYLENKESVKLSKLYELTRNKNLDSEIKSRLKNVISLKEKQLDNTLNNLDNLVKI